MTYHDARQSDLFAALDAPAPPRQPAPERFILPDNEVVPTGSTFDTERPPAPPLDPNDFASLHGNEIAKRALEIAAVAGHSVALVATAVHDASALLAAATKIGVRSGCVTRNTGKAAFDLIVEVHAPRDCDRQTEQESSATIAARIEAAQLRRDAIPAGILDEPAKKLLMDASVAMRLDRERVARLMSVARSIAALAGVERIGRIHIAEALAYSQPIEPPPEPEPQPEPEPPAPDDESDDDPHGIAACQARWVGDKEIVEVDPERLEFRKGDIANSYSAQSLAEEGRVKSPFKFRGGEWVNTGGWGFKGKSAHQCYRVVPVEQFDGAHAPYRDHDWRGRGECETLGNYHGMSAKHGSREIVLQGPPIVVVEGKPEQAGLL